MRVSPAVDDELSSGAGAGGEREDTTSTSASAVPSTPKSKTLLSNLNPLSAAIQQFSGSTTKQSEGGSAAPGGGTSGNAPTTSSTSPSKPARKESKSGTNTKKDKEKDEPASTATAASPTKTTNPARSPASASPHKVIKKFGECLTLLPEEPWFKENAEKLRNHKFIRDCQKGKLTTVRAKKFAAETWYVVKSDAKSFEIAASLYPSEEDEVYRKFFDFLSDGCLYAFEHLQKLRKALKLKDGELEEYEPSSRTHWELQEMTSLLAVEHQKVMCCLHDHDLINLLSAVCYAMNYPIWRDMCAAIKKAIDEHPKYRLKEEDVSYFAFFSQSLDDMDEMVQAMVALADTKQGFLSGPDCWNYKRVKDSVRMLQGYLLEFWNCVYEEGFSVPAAP